ncbi:ABC transporter permease subunit [Actibacterium sp. 188UL27-1]|nr:ABC transporter permease subunit [Actibacterium sp. 188UL27-1]
MVLLWWGVMHVFDRNRFFAKRPDDIWSFLIAGPDAASHRVTLFAALLLVLALGRGAVGTVTIVAIMIFFPTMVACLRGLRQTPGQIVDVFDSYASGRMRLLFWARLPAMLPAFFASARMAVPAAVLAATTAEWLATGRGIGSLMALTASTSDYNMLWSAVVVLSVLATLAYMAVELVECRFLRQYVSEQVNR